MPAEVATVADDEAVVFDGRVARRYDRPRNRDCEQRAGPLTVRTLPRPPGERLATVATVNDVHFGETRCGYLAGLDAGPGSVRRARRGSLSAGHEPRRRRGDRRPRPRRRGGQRATSPRPGRSTSTSSFTGVYGGAFGDRLVVTRGQPRQPGRCWPGYRRPLRARPSTLDGVTLAVLDTSRPGRVGGEIDADQAEWLDELAARADGPVMVFGHHPLAVDDRASETVFGADAFAGSGLTPASAARLADVVARRPALVGYFAGHTHRNKLRHLPATGAFPWVEVACVKDFPGSWAEYRVFEGGHPADPPAYQPFAGGDRVERAVPRPLRRAATPRTPGERSRIDVSRSHYANRPAEGFVTGMEPDDIPLHDLLGVGDEARSRARTRCGPSWPAPAGAAGGWRPAGMVVALLVGGAVGYAVVQSFLVVDADGDRRFAAPRGCAAGIGDGWLRGGRLRPAPPLALE